LVDTQGQPCRKMDGAKKKKKEKKKEWGRQGGMGGDKCKG